MAALLCASCGGSGLHPVEGKVLFKGQGAKGAVVTFHPKSDDDKLTTLRPSGVTREDGSFTLSTQVPGDGAAPGEYLVTIVWPEEPKAEGKRPISTEPPPEPEDRLNGRYSDRTKSGLTAVVKAGKNQLEPFVLK